MAKRLGVCLVLMSALLLAAACTKFGAPSPGEEKIVIERLLQPNVIPAAWGKLISVNSNAAAEDWAQLWFQDEGGNIHMAKYNARDGYLSMNAITIRRD